jgi:predicted ArsR family transcriptional regulator
MLIVETIARIRREHLVKGKSIREIARELRLSRNTVRRVLRSGETAFSYEREVQPLPKLGGRTQDLDRLLAANANAASRERLTLIRVFEELRALGYAGGYDAVRRYARRWSREFLRQLKNVDQFVEFADRDAKNIRGARPAHHVD